MSKCKAKASQAHSGIPGIIQAYSGKPCVTLVYLEPWSIQSHEVFRARSICRTLAYSQSCYIQSPRIFRMLPYSKSEAYSELCQTSTMRHFAKIVNGYDYFWKLKLLTQYKFVEISNFYWGIFQEFCLRLLLQNTSSYICSNST